MRILHIEDRDEGLLPFQRAGEVADLATEFARLLDRFISAIQERRRLIKTRERT